MAYSVISQNNTTTTLADELGNVIHVPARVNLATSTNYTITKVNNNTATLEDENGNIIRDVPCVAVLYGGNGGGGSGAVDSVNGKTGVVVLDATDVGALPDSTVIPAAQVNSDWNANSGVAQILNKPTLGTAAAAATTDFATAAQGSLADTAVQPGDLATVATTGAYSDLIGTPSIPAAQVNSDWNSSSGVSEILNKPSLATVATSGAYSDLTGTPTIPSKAADVNAIPQLATLPTADSTNVGQLVQFSGVTGTYTNGYFYTSTYDSGAGTYSWVQTDVQPAGGSGSLPDQTGNAGKFLTTDGTDASWAKALANESTSSSSISIGSSLSKGNSVALGYYISMGGTSQYAVLVGNGVYTNKVYATAIGPSARVEGSSGTTIGYNSQANGINSVALGTNAIAQSNYSIQLGKGTNSTIGSLSVGLALDNSSYNNYTLLTVDGLIPADRIASTTGLTDGNYRLRLTMADGTPTLSWVAE